MDTNFPSLALLTRPRAILYSLCFALLSFPVIARSWFDYLIGGHGWRQGDWLINFDPGRSAAARSGRC